MIERFLRGPQQCEDRMPTDVPGGKPARCELPAGHYGHHRHGKWTWKRYRDDGDVRRSWVMSDDACKAAFGYEPPYQEEPPRSVLDGRPAPKFVRAYIEGDPTYPLVESES